MRVRLRLRVGLRIRVEARLYESLLQTKIAPNVECGRGFSRCPSRLVGLYDFPYKALTDSLVKAMIVKTPNIVPKGKRAHNKQAITKENI